ncbi:hypothetical protein, partial [Arhodomonas sp. KWT]|uniref:hypothetical protein n=1 Tax=Arhodomonas sp. KWT TaxID=2679915 RepID=UPI001969E404
MVSGSPAAAIPTILQAVYDGALQDPSGRGGAAISGGVGARQPVEEPFDLADLLLRVVQAHEP